MCPLGPASYRWPQVGQFPCAGPRGCQALSLLGHTRSEMGRNSGQQEKVKMSVFPYSKLARKCNAISVENLVLFFEGICLNNS